jgi:hypothetical protein
MTRRTRLVALAAVLGASCVLPTVTATTAEASVVTLPSGLLSVTVPLAATLSTSGSTISGSLGTTTVIDGRLASTGYSVSVSTSGFDLVGPAVTSNPATHIPSSTATVQVTGTTGGSATPMTPVALPSVLPIFVFTYGGAVATINLLSTYTLSLSIAVPSTAAIGRYTGTVTQTVV